MKDQKHQLSSEESMEIITRMIKTAQGNVKSASFYFLLWGWITIIASAGQFYLALYTDYHAPYIVWLLAVPGWIITFIYAYKQSQKERVKTYSDSLIMWTWIGFMISILIIIFAGRQVNYQITPLVMLFAGLCTFITGLVIRFKPLIAGGCSFWLLTPVALYLPVTYSPIVMAAGILLGYLIPAYMLKYQK